MRHYPRIGLFSEPGGLPFSTTYGMEFLTFAGGEPHVNVPDHVLTMSRGLGEVILESRVRESVDVWFTIMLGDILRHNGVKVHLIMPYFPGARQDRYTTDGSPFTANIMSHALAQVPWESITVWEPHSEAALQQIKRVPVWENNTIIGRPRIPDTWPNGKYAAIVAPDKGAVERSTQIASVFSIPVIQLEKVRDPSTGALTGFDFAPGHGKLPQGTYLLFDDICDGGGTFIGCSSLLDKNYRTRYGFGADIDLYVAHGIFSKGTEELFAHFTTIYSTTSWRTKQELDDMDVIAVPLYDGEQL